MKIDVRYQKILKGIAIIGMMVWHFWGNPQWITSDNMYRGFLPNYVYEGIGGFGNVCVSIFAFITGYSLCVNMDKWDDRKYRKSKVLSFLVEYWIYEAIFLIVGLLLKAEMPSIERFIANLFGLGTAIMEITCVPFAWYVSFYLSIILLYPVIKKVMNCSFPISCIWIFLIYEFIDILYFLCKDINYLGNFLRRENTLLIVFAGYIVAKYNIYERISKKKEENKVLYNFCICFIILLIAFFRIKNYPILVKFWGLIYTFAISIFVLSGLLKKGSVLEGILERLGNSSMGMWFISGIFFIKNGSLQHLVYFWKNPVLILIWVIIVTFLLAKIIEGTKRLILTKIKFYG